MRASRLLFSDVNEFINDHIEEESQTLSLNTRCGLIQHGWLSHRETIVRGQDLSLKVVGLNGNVFSLQGIKIQNGLRLVLHLTYKVLNVLLNYYPFLKYAMLRIMHAACSGEPAAKYFPTRQVHLIRIAELGPLILCLAQLFCFGSFLQL